MGVDVWGELLVKEVEEVLGKKQESKPCDVPRSDGDGRERQDELKSR